MFHGEFGSASGSKSHTDDNFEEMFNLRKKSGCAWSKQPATYSGFPRLRSRIDRTSDPYAALPRLRGRALCKLIEVALGSRVAPGQYLGEECAGPDAPELKLKVGDLSREGGVRDGGGKVVRENDSGQVKVREVESRSL